MNFKLLNNLGGWLVFAIAFYTYGTTIEPTTSFWDCGEYIATSYKLEVGHPPGAPTFLLMARLFSMFVAPTKVAMMVNLMSALMSALTILFLFWTITYLAKKFVADEEMTQGNMIAILGSSLLGSLTFTFTDTFWFSAVEGEVYATSSFMTALVFWAILKWESVADEPHSNRWLIFIWFIIGISIGVHLLNLLAIPAIIFVYYFKRYPKPTQKGMLITFLLAVGILGFVQMFLIPQIVNFAAKFDLFFTNSLGMPFNFGATVLGLVILGAIIYGLYYTQKSGKVLANTMLLSFTMLMIGYMTFGTILIRSNANPPIDENNPENMVNLLSYLKREQYGDIPLLYGQYFNTPLDKRKPYKDGDPVYYPDEKTGKYIIIDDKKNSIPNYAKEFEGIFPRMWSSKGNHVRAYKAWSDFKGKKMRYYNVQTGKEEVIAKPTFSENMKYFFRYQMWWMWGRYFAWNFIGRQNDIQGHHIDNGKLTNGNMATGIRFFDEMIMGNLDHYPSELDNNKAHNVYFFLPFLLGLIGLFFQYKYDSKGLLVVSLLFFFTGIAIGIYLNMYPYQPRERDYAFVGSFYTYAIWVGLSVIGLYRQLRDKISPVALASGLTLVGLVASPVILAKENWDDHDRSNRYTAREIARNYLDSCDKNAILFTNGDNDTFPLWYLQEVEEYRTDVRVVNLMLLNTDWYIEQMARKAYDGLPIPISLKPEQYRQGTRDFIRYLPDKRLDQNKYWDIKQIVKFITSDENKVRLSNGEEVNIIPTHKFKLKVDKQKVMNSGMLDTSLYDRIVDEIRWKTKGSYILKNEMMVWDMLAHFNWDRPIYFSITMGKESFYGLENYFQQEGFAYRLVPIRSQGNDFRDFGIVDTDKMYERLVEKFKWGGYSNPDLWMDENNQRFITNIRFTFARLAKALNDEGDTGRALKTLDKCVHIAVNDNYSYNATLLPIIEEYFRAGANEKALDLLRKLVNRETEFLDYFFDQNDEEIRRLKGRIQQSIGALGQAIMFVSQKYPQDQAVIDEFTALYGDYEAIYNSLGI